MSPWTEQFVEVVYRARQFYLAWDEAHPLITSLCLIQQANLARARKDLECALAEYQRFRQGQLR